MAAEDLAEGVPVAVLAPGHEGAVVELGQGPGRAAARSGRRGRARGVVPPGPSATRDDLREVGAVLTLESWVSFVNHTMTYWPFAPPLTGKVTVPWASFFSPMAVALLSERSSEI